MRFGQSISRPHLADGDYRSYVAGRFIGVVTASADVVRARRLLATGEAGRAPAALVESLES
jgi:hypothetical protein